MLSADEYTIGEAFAQLILPRLLPVSVKPRSGRTGNLPDRVMESLMP